MIIFTIIFDPDPLLFPDPFKQIISDSGGSGSGSTTLLKGLIESLPLPSFLGHMLLYQSN
jgi:hypothetical protein